jgi:hypothetical protein
MTLVPNGNHRGDWPLEPTQNLARRHTTSSKDKPACSLMHAYNRGSSDGGGALARRRPRPIRGVLQNIHRPARSKRCAMHSISPFPRVDPLTRCAGLVSSIFQLQDSSCKASSRPTAAWLLLTNGKLWGSSPTSFTMVFVKSPPPSAQPLRFGG